MGTSEQNTNARSKNQRKALAKLSVQELLKRGFMDAAKPRIGELYEDLQASKIDNEEVHKLWGETTLELQASQERVADMVRALGEVLTNHRLPHAMRAKGKRSTTEICTKALSGVDAGTGWISVEDRLPDSLTVCYIINGTSSCVAEMTPSGKWYVHSPYSLEPTHWMPIPPLPSDKTEAK